MLPCSFVVLSHPSRIGQMARRGYRLGLHVLIVGSRALPSYVGRAAKVEGSRSGHSGVVAERWAWLPSL